MLDASERKYWFMRMRQGKDGEDFAKELWTQGLCGVMFGTWTIEHVLDPAGEIDRTKLTCDAIQSAKPQPWKPSLKYPKRFLQRVSVGDRVIVVFDNSIHVGEIADGFRPDPKPPRGRYEEHFKCRPLTNCRSFALAALPSSYRLLCATGRGAIERIVKFKRLADLLDRSESASELSQAMLDMPVDQFLGMLSDRQWEVLCCEYLRVKEGFRPLPLAIGRTLKGVDIVGIDCKRRRVVAQCKNDESPLDTRRLPTLINEMAALPEDRKFVFWRGRVADQTEEIHCELVSGQKIADWLNSEPQYLQDLKSK